MKLTNGVFVTVTATAAAVGVLAFFAINTTYGAPLDAPQTSGIAAGVISSAGDGWVEIQPADQAQKVQRFSLPQAGIMGRTPARSNRLEDVFGVAVGSEVTLAWQMNDGKATAVGMIVKSTSPADTAGGLAYAEPPPKVGAASNNRPAPESVELQAASAQASVYSLVARPWPTSARENPDPFDSDYGTFMGFVSAKGGNDWIDVRPLGGPDVLPVRFTPQQVRPVRGGDAGMDVRVQEAIRLLPVGTRVQVYWIYDDGKRAVRIIPSTQDGQLAVE